jgi:hypothetical protein
LAWWKTKDAKVAAAEKEKRKNQDAATPSIAEKRDSTKRKSLTDAEKSKALRIEGKGSGVVEPQVKN